MTTRARAWVAAVALFAASAAWSSSAAQTATSGAKEDASAAPARAEALERRRIEEWRDSLLIDRPRDVLAAAEQHAEGVAWNGEELALAARAAFATRGREAANAWLARTPVRAETSAWIELERARIALESDELGPALAALVAKPEDRAPKLAAYPDAWLYTGRAWTRLGDSTRGASFFARFVELAPFDVEATSAMHALAQDAVQRGDGAAARAWIQRADENGKWQSYRRVRVLQIRESPDEPLPRQGLAQLWLQARDPLKASAVLEELLARHPQHAQGWFLLGECERTRERLEPAAEAYGKALEFEPEHVLARHNRGVIHRLRGRLGEARADFERIVDGPRAAEKTALGSHLALARVLIAQGERTAAEQRYARYRELGGAEPLAQ